MHVTEPVRHVPWDAGGVWWHPVWLLLQPCVVPSAPLLCFILVLSFQALGIAARSHVQPPHPVGCKGWWRLLDPLSALYSAGVWGMAALLPRWEDGPRLGSVSFEQGR